MRNQNEKLSNEDYVGTVLWFREDLGFGFIECDYFKKPDGNSHDIFAHFSRISTDEKFKTLAKSQIVQFQVAITTKGLMAVNIRELKIPLLKATVVENVNENQT